jgi:tetratricopeptide (TPR) repeat protein
VVSDEEFEALFEFKAGEDIEDDLDHLALLIDASFDLQIADGLRRALVFAESIDQRDLEDAQVSRLYYFISNAWADLHQLEIAGRAADWDWEQPCLGKQVFHLRRAMALLPAQPPEELACPFFTNLGNGFNSIGRVVEAIEYWQRALEFEPMFGMALGNLGIGFCSYAEHLYDQGHAAVILKSGHECLEKAIDCDIHASARDGFSKKARQIEGFFKDGIDSVTLDFHDFSLGSTPEEIEYRKWCLEQRLFLNPLNELGPFPIAGRDILTEPPIVVGLEDGPYYPGFFNQMKQEFASARFILFEGIQAAEPHYSDAEVHLYNTLDYPCYGLTTEKVRIAFRMAYSLLDKVAFFLNHYLGLGIKEWQVSFKSLWYRKGKSEKGLREFFVDRRNLPLRGLFWLSKDLSEDRGGFREAIEPEAQEIRDIRNCLEHRYLKLHEDLWRGPAERDDPLSRGMTDTLAKSLYLDAFEKKTLKLLRLARAALIYLSLGVHTEERIWAAEREGEGIAVPMLLDEYEDRWKR